jgi:hypothetical protein
MASTRSITESDILEKVVCPQRGDLSPDAARSLLTFTFDRRNTTAIRALLRKNNRATVSAEERLTLEKYLRVGPLLDLLHAKAQLALHGASTSQYADGAGNHRRAADQ